MSGLSNRTNSACERCPNAMRHSWNVIWESMRGTLYRCGYCGAVRSDAWWQRRYR